MNKLDINFYTILLSKNSILLPYIQYLDNDQINNLKSGYPNLAFKKDRDKIYFWNNEDSSLKEDGFETISLQNNFYVFLKILEICLRGQFYSDKIKFKCKKKIYYQVTLLDEDISESKFKGLKFYKCVSINFQSLFFDNQEHLGFTISFSIKEVPYWTKQEFVNNNIQSDDLQFDEETGIVINSLHTIQRLTKHFNYASERKLKLDALNSVENEFMEINNFVKTYFENNKDNFILPDDLKVLGFKTQDIQVSNLVEPECYFYKGKYPTFLNQFNKRQKIGYNKPFSYDEFENRKIRIKIFYPQDYETDIRNFFSKVKKELSMTFKIPESKIEANGVKIQDTSLKSYQRTLSNAKDIDLAVIVISQQHEGLPTSESPYYFCKSELLKREINVQDVQIEQVQSFLQGYIKYYDHNISLNIYAKLGGMAWTIKPKEPKNELVIGIGATTDKDGQPLLGLATIFRGDGKYLFGSMFGQVNSVTTMEDYRKNLEQLLTENIQKYIDDGILEVGIPFNLIFHIYKSAGKDNEIKALENVIKKFSNYQFEYTFVHIGFGHNYRLFAKSIDKKQRRGIFAKINDWLGFLCLTPVSSNYCKIEIDKRSSKVELETTVKQVYEFAELSHTSYNKSGKPVTIKYTNLMASFAEKFGQIEGFYLDELKMSDNSLWFI